MTEDLTKDPSENLAEEDEHLGLISNAEKTDKGFLFDLTNIEGETIRCFFNGTVEETDRLQILSGTFSKDHIIFFFNDLHKY